MLRRPSPLTQHPKLLKLRKLRLRPMKRLKRDRPMPTRLKLTKRRLMVMPPRRLKLKKRRLVRKLLKRRQMLRRQLLKRLKLTKRRPTKLTLKRLPKIRKLLRRLRLPLKRLRLIKRLLIRKQQKGRSEHLHFNVTLTSENRRLASLFD